jgi:glutathione synthase/RimK-type ligase-like ATP-grasp enzyme
MTELILATCRAKPALTAGDGLLADALRRLGAGVVAVPWDGIDPERPEGIVCLRSTWDYHLRWDEFRQWVRGFGRRGRLWNPAETVLWNADKRYLRDLAAAGIALPRTRWFDPGERPDVAAVLEEWGLPRAVLKPRVSATAFGTHVASADSRLSEEEWAVLERAGCLLQAFVPEIQSRGEVSLVFLGGSFSHAVLKRPVEGDFRVQSDFGGTVETATPTPSAVAFGQAALSASARPWIYARVDLVETDGGPVLMELELIEPYLFLTPAAATRLAEALVAAAEEEGP